MNGIFDGQTMCPPTVKIYREFTWILRGKF
jgi:hypothetical protein